MPDITGHPEYSVGECGCVFSKKSNKTLKWQWSNGYPNVTLHTDGVSTQVFIHRVVAETFIGSRPNGSQVRHLDGDKSNPHISNLKYGTGSENQQDRLEHGTHNRGERSGMSKITDDQAADMRKLYSRGGITQRELGVMFGISRSAAGYIVTYKSYMGVCHR